ncbi:MAG: transaldolase family protein [Polyangiales bacterium]
MTLGFETEFWNDGCESETLARAIEHGATGATSNPVLVLEAIEANPERWREETRRLLREHPTETEEGIAWRLVEVVATAAAKQLLPLFESSGGARGRLSLQVGPRIYPDAKAMVAQAMHFSTLAPNMAVKLPAVAGGLEAIEELTANGVYVNATVSFTVPQAVAVAEAMERGIERAKRAGRDTSKLTPWVTVMVGRLDDHLRDEAKARGIDIDPEVVRQASTAVFRRTHKLFRERGYRAKALAAAMRSHHHWSDFIGGDVVVTIPPSWQEKFNASGVEVVARMENEVDPKVVQALRDTFPDFVRAFEPDGMAPGEFVGFGAAKKTLHQFINGYEKLLAFVRNEMLPLAPKGKE